jgi:chemotaxis signal transduction protein/anti-anti-sigma regulatory factor
LTIAPAGTDVYELRLPAGVDTLEALRFRRRLQEAAAHSSSLFVDASAVEEIGLAGLQLLALVSAILAGGGGSLVLAQPSPACRTAISDAGLEVLLINRQEASPAETAGDKHILIFTDGALDYGREPVEALHRLREAGAEISAFLPNPLPSIDAIEADRLFLRFEVALPNDASSTLLSDALAEFGGDALVDTPSPAKETVAAKPEPPATVAPASQNAKFERLMSDIEELLTRHAALAARFPSLDRDVVTELKAMEALLRDLQEQAMAAGLVRLGTLLQRRPTQDQLALSRFPGSDIEIEPAVIEPLLPFLATLLDRKRPQDAGLSAHEAEGQLMLDIPLSAAERVPPGLTDAAAAVRGRVTLVSGDNPVLRIELPRSMSMLEALIVRAGTQLGALPVERAIEILRPEPGTLTSIGSGSQLMRFRGAYLPIVDLAAALAESGEEGGHDMPIVVVVQSAGGNYGVAVSEVTDHRQIMVKPLEEGLSTTPSVIGLSFSAGGIALVLDVDALRQEALGGAASA